MIGVYDMTNPRGPQQSWTPVAACPYPFVVLYHLDAFFGDFHFLLNVCDPNQNAMIDEKMMAESSSQSRFSA